MAALRGNTGPLAERRTAAAALALLAGIIAADAASQHASLGALLVLGPLVAALACRARLVMAFGAGALLACLALGQADGGFGSGRHLIGLAVVAGGAVLAVAGARTRATLARVRDIGVEAYRRIALLDRSSRLIAAPMDFRVRLQELARLPVPDVADLCVIDLASDDGRLDGAVVAAAAGGVAERVEAARRAAPIDTDGPHPVAVALRTGEPQLREEMTQGELGEYATSAEHRELMRELAYRSAIVVPLIARGTTLGVLSVLRLGQRAPFGPSDVALMTDLASRAAVAVDTSRLFQEQQRAQTQLRTVIDGLAEAIVMVSRDGELVYVNDAGARLFGHERAGELPPTRLRDVHAGYELFAEDGTALDPAVLPGRRVLDGEPAEPVTYRRRHVETGREEWLTVKASAVLDPSTGEPILAVNVIEDITQERRARETASFLSEASKLLASSLDFTETLGGVARAAVPQIADWCAVELLDASGRLEQLALAHVEPEKTAIATELRERYPASPDSPSGGPHVARTGVSELHPEVAFEQLAAEAVDARHLELLRALDITSVLIVPMKAGTRTIGVISFVTTGGRRRLTEADRALGEELARRAGVAVEHARVHLERSHVAATLQRSLLPPRLPVVPGVTLAARFRAAGEGNQVGGDFYDLFRAGDSWIVVIGDVTGKGPAAAAITSLARYTIRTAALYEDDPAGIMRRLNEALLSDDADRQMCTAACLRLTSPGEGRPLDAELVCAGHPPPFLLRGEGEVEELCRPGPLLGAFSEATWEASAFALAPGDGIVLYTDGVTDARGGDGRFGEGRLGEVLRGMAGMQADAVAARIDGTLLAFQEGPQRDDVALLVLRAEEPAQGAETTVVAGSASTPA